jgi:hypothetical protein
LIGAQVLNLSVVGAILCGIVLLVKLWCRLVASRVLWVWSQMILLCLIGRNSVVGLMVAGSGVCLMVVGVLKLCGILALFSKTL